MNIKNIILASRPQTLAAAVIPVLTGLTIAGKDGYLDIPLAIIIVVAAAMIQVGTNYINDLYDYLRGVDSHTEQGPERMVASGMVSPKEVVIATIAAFGLACILGLYLIYRGGWPILIIGIVSIMAGIFYTAGPKPLAYKGLGDIMVLLFFGPIASAGTYWLQAGQFSLTATIIGLSPGLIAVCILTANNLRDLTEDKQHKKHTLVVRFGPTFGKAEYIICIITGFTLPAIYNFFNGNQNPRIIFMPLALLLAIPLIKVILTSTNRKKLDKIVELTGKMLVLFGILFLILWLF